MVEQVFWAILVYVQEEGSAWQIYAQVVAMKLICGGG